MWRLIFSFLTFLNIMQFIYPFLIKVDVKCNILKLKGGVCFKFFNKIKFNIKFRVKNGYVYIYFNNKERKEKISKKNVNILFIVNFVKQFYFRQQWLDFKLTSNFGFVLDSCVTATSCGIIDLVSNSILSKIKNNKKSAHIFIDVEPKYNEDIFNIKIENITRISVFDIIYTLVVTIIKFVYLRKIKNI